MPSPGRRHSMSHTIKMLIGCILPFLLIFLLPLLGIPQGATTMVFFVLMLGCHLMMMGGHEHGHGGHDHHRDDDDPDGERTKEAP